MHTVTDSGSSVVDCRVSGSPESLHEKRRNALGRYTLYPSQSSV